MESSVLEIADLESVLGLIMGDFEDDLVTKEDRARQGLVNVESSLFHGRWGARKTDYPPGVEGFLVDRVEKRRDMSLLDV